MTLSPKFKKRRDLILELIRNYGWSKRDARFLADLEYGNENKSSVQSMIQKLGQDNMGKAA